MANLTKRLFFIAVLLAGFGMMIWGWHAFTKAEPVPSLNDEDSHRICAPTISEIIEDSPLPRKLGFFVITCVGMGVAGFSLLSLMKGSHEISSA